MKENKNPPKWVVDRFMNNRSLEIPFDFELETINMVKLRRNNYVKRPKKTT